MIHNSASEDEQMEPVMVTTVGRNSAAVQERMAQLWAEATKRNLAPVSWQLGFFIHRDLIEARDPNFRCRPWMPIETMWGCGVQTTMLEDHIELVARGEIPGVTNLFHSLVAKDV